MKTGSRFIWVWLVLIWISHFLQVLVPETGFDAVWYHLPIIKASVEAGRWVYIPELYQSVNPFLADAILSLGWLVAGEMGVKLVAFAMAVSLVVVVYHLARKWMSKEWSLWTVVIVSQIQPIAWQAASAYIDVIKALWEVAMIFVLVSESKKNAATKVGLLWGASLASKLFSVVLSPVVVVMMYWKVAGQHGWVKQMLVMSFVAGVMVAPMYWWAYLNTGQWWPSAPAHIGKLAEIGGEANLFSYVWNRTMLLPTSLWEVVVARDYVSPLLIGWWVLFILRFKSWWKNVPLRILMVWSVAQWLVWWYLPPLSTRYALSGFIVMIVMVMMEVAQYAQQNKSKYWAMVLLLVIVSGWALLPRLVVNQRSLVYLTRQQSKTKYVRQFLDGHIDQHLLKWHQLTQ